MAVTGSTGLKAGVAVQDERWCLLDYADPGRRELYDKDCDREEAHNVIDAHPEEVERLHGEFLRFLQAHDAHPGLIACYEAGREEDDARFYPRPDWIDVGARVISLPEDLGSQTGSLTGPRMFRKWVTPYHRALHDMAHGAGCLTDFHCDGNIMDVADQILEIGPDSFNPQDMANGVENLAEAFKERLCIRLDFDRQHAIPFGTPREIRELVEYEVRTLGSPSGGLMIRAGVRGDNIPPENIDALASALEELCTYWFD